MYIRPAFKDEDPEKIARFINQNSFATDVNQADGCLFASLPGRRPGTRYVYDRARAAVKYRRVRVCSLGGP